MRFEHPAHPGKGVRLAYCMNLHAGETLPEIRAGIERITVPLRERLAAGRPFGVGAYLPAAAALGLDAPELDELTELFEHHGLEPFTFNAFPYSGFHRDGLKERVYAPAWWERERVDYTLAVARIALALAARRGDTGHLSISTHPGAFGAWVDSPQQLHRCAEGMAEVASELTRMALEGGGPIVLSLEAEPRASAGDTRELAEFLVVARQRAARRIAQDLGLERDAAAAAAARHLGSCLDCCHAAVEFEPPGQALRNAHQGGAMGKLQFSSALALKRPGEDAEGCSALLAMHEPRYLHQVSGMSQTQLLQCADLPELAAALDGSAAKTWLACDEWRCHFHVPVDLDSACGLGTTREHADEILRRALNNPDSWFADDLHVEIETYTWDVLPGPARGAGDLVDGLEREYRHVVAQLDALGWREVGVESAPS